MPELELNSEADDQKLLALVVDFYHRTLKETAEGLDYLRRRGLTVGETVDRFRIGYANRTLGLSLPTIQHKAGRQIRTRLQQLGLYRGSGREHMNGCVVFPITACDGSGQIVDLYGRKTHNHLRKGTPMHMHLSEQRRGVWNVEAFEATEEIILCASLFDALTFWNAGYRNVTCTFGPEALTDDHLTAFHEFGIRRVLVASEAVVPRLLAAGIECYLLILPMGLDVNRYALQAADPAEALGAIIRNAVWQGKGAGPAVLDRAIPGIPDTPVAPNIPCLTDDTEDPEDDGPITSLGDELDDLDDDDELDEEVWEEAEEEDEEDGLEDGERGEGSPFSPSGGGRGAHGSARIGGTSCHGQALLRKLPRMLRAEVARGNPPRSGALCSARGVNAKKSLSLAALINHAARTRRAATYLNQAMRCSVWSGCGRHCGPRCPPSSGNEYFTLKLLSRRLHFSPQLRGSGRQDR